MDRYNFWTRASSALNLNEFFISEPLWLFTLKVSEITSFASSAPWTGFTRKWPGWAFAQANDWSHIDLKLIQIPSMCEIGIKERNADCINLMCIQWTVCSDTFASTWLLCTIPHRYPHQRFLSSNVSLPPPTSWCLPRWPSTIPAVSRLRFTKKTSRRIWSRVKIQSRDRLKNEYIRFCLIYI